MFYVTQLLMALFSFCCGMKEATIIEAVRKYPYGNPFEKPFHRWGWLTATVVGVLATLLQTHFKAQILSPFLSALIHWFVFEIPVNVFVLGKWNYVGTTAATDKWLWRTFGLKAEAWAVSLKIGGIAALNALYLIFP